jgi:hypothetical protein
MLVFKLCILLYDCFRWNKFSIFSLILVQIYFIIYIVLSFREEGVENVPVEFAKFFRCTV